MADNCSAMRGTKRGDQAIKWKPLAVAGTAATAIALFLPVGIAFFSPSPAVAADECGIIPAGGTATCTEAGNNYDNGISYGGNGITVDINGTGVVIDTTPSGNTAVNVLAVGNDGATVNVSDEVSITTTGANAVGILADNIVFGGGITVNSAADINTSGDSAHGIHALHGGNGLNSVTAAGTIATSGITASGIRAEHTATGDISVNSSATISTNNDASNGIDAWHTGTGDIAITSSGSVTTSGNVARGIAVRHSGDGDITLNAQGTIATSGVNSGGILAQNDSDGAVSIVNKASITTGNAGAHGLSASSIGAGKVSVQSYGNITTSGTNANSINVFDNNGGGYEINVLQGTLIGGTGTGTGIYANGSTGGTITIEQDAVVDGSAGAAGVRVLGGPATILSRGTILNGIDTTGTGVSSDRVTLAGQSVTTGIVATGQGDDQIWATDNADLTGVTQFDGGDGTDVMRFQEFSGSVAGPNVNNFEGFIVYSSTVGITGGALALNFHPDGGVYIWEGGTLNAGSSFSLNSNLYVDETSSFRGAGNGMGVFSIAGNASLLGTASLSDGAAGDRLVIGGNLASSGTVELDVNHTDATADQLLVMGDITGGQTGLRINNASTGAVTTDDITVVNVAGAANADSFFLLEPVIAGAYQFELAQSGQDWNLQHAGYAPTAPIYEALPQTLLAMNGLPTLQQRVGDSYWQTMTDKKTGRVSAIQTRVLGSHNRFKPSTSTTSASFDQNRWELHAGLDGQLSEGQFGRLMAGIEGFVGTATSDVSSPSGDGKISTNNGGVAATLTLITQNGAYVDGQARFNWYDSDLSGSTVGTTAKGVDGSGQSFSVEVGRRFQKADSWTITPQAQLVYSSVDFGTFTDSYGAVTSLDKGQSLRGRIGMSAGRQIAGQRAGDQANIYGVANLHYEFLGKTQVSVSGTALSSEPQRLFGEIGLGGSRSWGGGKYTVHGEVNGLTSLDGFGDSYGINGRAGMKVRF